jgi:hypothetical protein
MAHPDITAVKTEPRRFLDFLRKNRYAVYHRSNLFFRDFQYGLWRYLKENRTKISYAEMEKVAREVIDAWERQGTIRRIDHQSFELNMPEYVMVWPAKEAPAKEARATEPAATTGTADPDREATMAAMRAKMAAARAKREAGSDTRQTPDDRL